MAALIFREPGIFGSTIEDVEFITILSNGRKDESQPAILKATAYGRVLVNELRN